MNVKKLKKDMTIKNYKALCELLEIEVKGGDSKKSQLKELETYVKYHKAGNKFIIDEVYNNKLEKVDKRKEGNRVIFVDDIEKLLLNMIVNAPDYKVSISKGQLYKYLNITNDNYLLCREYIQELAELLELPQEAVYDFYDYNSSKLRETVERGLKRLRSRALANWDNTTTIAVTEVEIEYNKLDEPALNSRGEVIHNKKLVHRLADEYERNLILHYEYETLKEMDIATLKQCFLLGQWKKFKKQVERKLANDNTNIEYYYDTYTLYFNRADVNDSVKQLDAKEVKDIKANINKNMVESISKSTEKRKKKSKSLYQGSFGFIQEQEQLTFLLINKEAEVIKRDKLESIKADMKKKKSESENGEVPF